MSYKLAISLLTLFAASNAMAQGVSEDTSHHFRISLLIGGGSIASYDNFGSPEPYSGTTYPIGGEIEYITPNVRHLLSGIGIISLGNAANLTDQNHFDNPDRKAYYAFADLRYRFTHYLTDIGSTGVRLSIGGEWDNLAFGRVYDYSGNLTSSSGSGEASSGIAAACDFTYEIATDHRLGASISLPLAALVFRPAYGFINGNTSLFSFPLEDRFELIGTMWSWRIGLDYDYAISEPFLLGLHFHELYYQYPMLAWRAVGAENDLVLDVMWRFNL
jgi:hypothetical protein